MQQREDQPALDILLLGFSSIVARRVLPALQSLPGVGKIHVASRRPFKPETIRQEQRGQIFSDYAQALKQLTPGVAYISLPNSLHSGWVRQTLDAGFHVIVDKPAVTALHEGEDLLQLASVRGLCLAESTVWSFHPQFQSALRLLTELGQRVTLLNAGFSFPPLPRENFRNDPQLGGGCILDLGPYAASCGRLFFREPPLEILARITSRHPESALETAFSLLATYPDGGALTGHFGFDTEYRNSISVLGPALAMEFERAFTTPPDSAVRLPWRSQNQGQVLACPPGDSFALFLEAVFEAIRRRDWSQFSSALQQDARFIERLKRATSVSAEGG